MPRLNVLTWNSTGETAQGALELQRVIRHLMAYNWQPNVIVIQEANAAPSGEIYRMLAGLGGPHNYPVHVTETAGAGGRGYILATDGSVTGQATFARCDFAVDPSLQAWITGNLSPRARADAARKLAVMRMPARVNLRFQNAIVKLLTWHAPRGAGHILPGILDGGADPDAYLFLQNSSIHQELCGQGPGSLGVIAGDLNVTFDQLNRPTGFEEMPRVLPGWVGVSNRLDHIMARPSTGQRSPDFLDSGNFLASGSHNVLISTVRW